METEKKANMITRSMREGTLLGLVVMLVVLYLLYTYGYLQPLETWKNRIEAGITIVLLPIGLGAIYGFFQGYRVKRRVDLVRETLVNWEKGSLTDVMPDIGEDEVGRLGEQLVKISKRWEDQVSSLQRLSTNNAQLAEQPGLRRLWKRGSVWRASSMMRFLSSCLPSR